MKKRRIKRRRRKRRRRKRSRWWRWMRQRRNKKRSKGREVELMKYSTDQMHGAMQMHLARGDNIFTHKNKLIYSRRQTYLLTECVYLLIQTRLFTEMNTFIRGDEHVYSCVYLQRQTRLFACLFAETNAFICGYKCAYLWR